MICVILTIVSLCAASSLTSFRECGNRGTEYIKNLGGEQNNLDIYWHPEYLKICRRLRKNRNGLFKPDLSELYLANLNGQPYLKGISIYQGIPVCTLSVTASFGTFYYYEYEGFLAGALFLRSLEARVIETEYFRIFFNNRKPGIKKRTEADRFVKLAIRKLAIPNAKEEILKREKIFYRINESDNYAFFRKASDFILSPVFGDKHEIIHFLAFFSLDKTPPYTHPVFEEGLACAFGGRGKLSAEKSINNGKKLLRNLTVNPTELYSKKKLNNPKEYDASAACAELLIKQKGIVEFMRIYSEFSGNIPGGKAASAEKTKLQKQNKTLREIKSLIQISIMLPSLDERSLKSSLK
ncbi:MAG: hypothetical protein ACLFQK_12295 [Fibrobacterota bacterium]